MQATYGQYGIMRGIVCKTNARRASISFNSLARVPGRYIRISVVKIRIHDTPYEILTQ